ncbi:MAG: iron-sulfur cluster assembly accessory protein [Sphingomonas sp. 12-62-6]|nr:MAG: iron-sulfur cluster assembly accessory protein [Sphingomonas sp. 12-62-6]
MTDTQDVTITAAAAARVAAIAAKQGKPAILRLAVDGGGCSGFQYKFGMADDVASDDTVAERDGVRLVVDSVSLDLVRGCSVDFVESLAADRASRFDLLRPPIRVPTPRENRHL